MTALSEQLAELGFKTPQRLRRTPVSRASFTLTDREALLEAVQLATGWIAKTAAIDLSPEMRCGSPFDEESKQATASAFRLDDEQGSIWAARVAYRGDRTAARIWITDLFVEQRKGALTRFGAQLNCECALDDPGFEHSRPRIVRDALERLAAEADDVPLSNEIEPVSIDRVEELATLLYNPLRRLPVIVISTDNNGGAQVNLHSLATKLSGTAHLRSVAIEESFELSRTVGSRMSAYNGAIRLYMPGLEQETEDPFQHPLWLAPSTGWNPRVIGQLASRVLPLGFRDADGDTRFWRIGLLRQAVSRATANSLVGSREEQLLAEIEALRFERDSAREAAENADSLMYGEASKSAVLSSNSSASQEETFSLRERLRFNEASVNRTPTSVSADDIYAVFERDPTLEVSLRMVSSVFSDRVAVLPSAYVSAREAYVFKHRSKAFDLLWSLCTSYWSAISAGEGDFTARQCFGSAYAAKEASSLSNAGRKRRTFEYNGIQMEMEKHLKIGVADNKADTLRVHFEWIAQDKVIAIGHCGAHLDF